MSEQVDNIRCELILKAGNKHQMQCPRRAVGFWNRGTGYWHPACQQHLDSLQAANLAKQVRYAKIAPLEEAVLRAKDHPELVGA